MKSKFSQRLEILTNISIIVLSVLIGYFLIQKFYFQEKPQKPPTEIVKGTKISLPEVDWQANQKTVVLALQKGCRFCTDSMPFYKTLVEKAREKGVKLLAVLPDSREEGIQYLKENGVEIQEIRQIQLSAVNVRGTPTLMLINDKGEVSDSWIGKLTSEREKSLLNAL